MNNFNEPSAKKADIPVSVMQKMVANSKAWSKTTDKYERGRLHAENVALAKPYGLQYNSAKGTWHPPGGSSAKPQITAGQVKDKLKATGLSSHSNNRGFSGLPDIKTKPGHVGNIFKGFSGKMTAGASNNNRGFTGLPNIKTQPGHIGNPFGAFSGQTNSDQYNPYSTGGGGSAPSGGGGFAPPPMGGSGFPSYIKPDPTYNFGHQGSIQDLMGMGSPPSGISGNSMDITGAGQSFAPTPPPPAPLTGGGYDATNGEFLPSMRRPPAAPKFPSYIKPGKKNVYNSDALLKMLQQMFGNG